jgi:hypothetical protein
MIEKSIVQNELCDESIFGNIDFNFLVSFRTDGEVAVLVNSFQQGEFNREIFS